MIEVSRSAGFRTRPRERFITVIASASVILPNLATIIDGKFRGRVHRHNLTKSKMFTKHWRTLSGFRKVYER